jgi:hypothetical protein
MLLGVLLGAAVETFIPEETFTHYLGGTSVLGHLRRNIAQSHRCDGTSGRCGEQRIWGGHPTTHRQASMVCPYL